MLNKILKIGFYTIFVSAFLFVSGKLFFAGVLDDIFGDDGVVSEQGFEKDVLRLVLPEDLVSVEPTLADPATRQRLLNVYESMVKLDGDLNPTPALAVNWGLIDDLTWEFRLRPNVKFHDGSFLDSRDVEASLERAMYFEKSEIAGFLNTIKNVEVFSDTILRIETYEPDPLLLQRIAMVLVFPKEFADEEDIYPPVGTAPYIFSQWQKGEKIVFENNPDYWGDIGKYGQVEIFGRSDKFERVDLLTEQGADFLAFTPFDAVSALEDAGFKTVAIPSLEVQFLIFNFDSKIFKDSQARKMISLAIDPNDLVDLVGGFATASTQFVSNGILGFSPKLAEHQYNLLEAEKIANEFELKGRTIKFTLSKGLDVLGEYVREQMRKIGVRVIVSYLDGAELYESMFAGDSDFYFLAFKSDFGDASSFYDVLVHSLGEFNIAKYRDEFVDKLIEESRVEMDASIRRKNLQKIMEILVGDNFGVPLFEYETVYSMPQNVSITPRIDGFIYFDDIKIENGI